jgi:DNA-binding LacI/PurR family transcriptional regulator
MTIKKKHTTIRDIAKLADVSYQTVSLVINGKPGVSEKTRKRILRLMDEMDYRPNRAAQMLSTNRSNTLELIVVDVVYGGRLADSTKNMVRAARASGYGLLISETTFEALPDALEGAAARLVDGILMYAPRLRIADEDLLEMCNGIPLVRRDYVPGSKIAWVGFDQAYATRLVTEHLIELGHRHIAAIPPNADMINGYWRYTTWKNVLLEHGLEPGLAVTGDYSMQSGYEAAQQIIASGKPFTAILVGSDNMAVGALRALREAGLRVPDDVSVAGFDNTELSSYIDPQLTTIEFKFEKQDELAVKYLLELIEDPQMELHQRVLMSDLIVRGSTRALHPSPDPSTR